MIKARPCPKCGRPADCQKTCEDVVDREKELEDFRESETELDKEVMQLKRELVETEKDLLETKNLLLELKQKQTYPKCYGFDKVTDDCKLCPHISPCAKTEEKKDMEKNNKI